MKPVILRSERLELSTPVVEDIDDITRICQDGDIQRWTTVPSPYSRSHSVGFVTDLVVKGWESTNMLTWGIREAATGSLLGMVSLTRLDESAAELGYWMAPEARGRGVMSGAVQLVLDYGFSGEGMALGRIEWHAYIENFSSAAVARRAGFSYEGVLRMEGLQRGIRHDSWVAGLLPGDSRDEKPGWPIEPLGTAA